MRDCLAARGDAGAGPDRDDSLRERGRSNRDFLEGNQTTTPVVIAGHLQIPSAAGAARAPAVVLMHGCGGWSGADEGGAQEFPRLGIATFRIDSFSGRGIREACTGQSQIGLGSRVVDAYRALELLATHPQIDPERIALIGFSQGGGVTLRAAMTRFQRAWAPPGRRFAAYLALYPAGCWFSLIDDVHLDGRPVRIFHGMADDWTPVGPCRAHGNRTRRAGSDIAIMEYPGAHHGFDNRQLPPAARRPDVLNPGHCQWIEESPGRVIDRETGRPASADAPCVRRGATVGYQATPIARPSRRRRVPSRDLPDGTGGVKVLGPPWSSRREGERFCLDVGQLGEGRAAG